MSEELLPCRACGEPCRVERFEASRYLCQPVDLWMCSANEKFGGSCPDGMAYLSAEAWNTRASPSPDRVELVEKVARAIHNAAPCSDDEETNDVLFGEMRHVRLDQARAAIAAIEAGDHIPPVDGGVGDR